MSEGKLGVTPYWPPLSIDGETIDLRHLEPFRLVLDVRNLGRELAIDVRFSNHCFTGHFIDGTHDPGWLAMDHKVKRFFCRTRYGLSGQLPHMVRALTAAATSVWQTRHERNYVYFVHVEDAAGDRYPMFFTLKKAKGASYQLAMMVESAYPVSKAAMDEILRSSNKVAFPVLCAKVFQNQPLRFNARR